MDLLDQQLLWFLQSVYALLKPGGEVIFYESNPWNPLLGLRRLLGALLATPTLAACSTICNCTS